MDAILGSRIATQKESNDLILALKHSRKYRVQEDTSLHRDIAVGAVKYFKIIPVLTVGKSVYKVEVNMISL